MSAEATQSENDSGAPSNVELAERTARVEEKIDAQGDTLERIETALVDDHEDLAEQVDENDQRITPVYQAYRLGKYVLPVLGTLAGTAAALGVL